MPADVPPPVTAATDWEITDAALRAKPTRWRSLSWISARALIDAVNQSLNVGADGLITQLRGEWIRRGGGANPQVIDRSGDTCFIVLGDTGEQDASQFVVCPALSKAVRDHQPGFVLIMSDVIYPAGDVDDYRDGLYRPYRSEDPNFRVAAPLLALPGNHDWYDGLAGFMYHFCGRDRLPPEAYAPGFSLRSLYGRLFRILWRRAGEPGRETRELRALSPPTRAPSPSQQAIEQPGSYYAIRTAHLMIITIDTGIDGTIDQDQWDWLSMVSAEPVPKILLTGKPLVVNAALEPCWVGGRPKRGEHRPSVWDLINDPANSYVATIGGDAHNFQCYSPKESLQRGGEAGVPQLHLVAGCGGAFMHGTHNYLSAEHDSRIRHSPKHQFYKQPDWSFPTPADSFAYFAGQLVPSVIRTMRYLALFLLGVLGAATAYWLAGGPASGLVAMRWTGRIALIALIILVIFRSIRRYAPRASPLARGVAALGFLLVGVLATSTASQLDPAPFSSYLLCWIGLTAFHCLIGLCVRLSGWWRPADEYAHNSSTLVFGVGLLCLCVLAFGVLWILDPAGGADIPLVGAGLFFVVGWLGWVLRRPRFSAPGVADLDRATEERLGRQNRRWHLLGAVLMPLTQVGYFALALRQISLLVGRGWLFTAAIAGIGVLLLIVAAASVTVVLITELLAVLAIPMVRNYRRGWGLASSLTHHLMIPLLLLAVAVAIVYADSSAARGATGLSLVLIALAGLVLGIERLRQRLPRAYLPITLLVIAALAAAAYLYGGWPARVALGTTIILLAFGISITLGHLAFLDAYALLITPGGLGTPSFTPDQIEEIFRARRQTPPRLPDVPANALLWARLTSPGLGEPGGPLQRRIAEIYSRDEPPFYKGFLRLDTTPDEVTITLHEVFGNLPATAVPVAKLRLSPKPLASTDPIL